MIFLDHAATTPMDPRLTDSLLAGLRQPQNSSSVHWHGQRARARLEEARADLGQLLALPPNAVVFTSGASEANNLALRGFAAARRRPIRVVTSPLEHSCIRETLRVMEANGTATLHNLPVNTNGSLELDPAAFENADLLCMMAVQNETGVILPMENARRLLPKNTLWLCDATQAIGAIPMEHSLRGYDLMSFSSHKIYGPPGVGALVGPAVEQLVPIITGGPQEGERRAGTQPVALILAFVEAVRLAIAERDARSHHLKTLEAYLLNALRAAAIPFQLNGSEHGRLPGFLNLSITGLTGPDAVIALDTRGISASSGSACATGVMEVSPTLAAMFPHDETRAAAGIRITMGKDTTEAELGKLVSALRAGRGGGKLNAES